WRHFLALCKTAPKSDIAVLVITFALTVIFDLVVAIAAGLILSLLFFVVRMHGTATVAEADESDDVVAVYLLSGPLFFGATQQIDAIEPTAGRHVVLDMTAVSAVDATGLHSLEALRDRCEAVGVELDIRGLSAQPGKTLDHAGFIAHTQARMK
ncbi:MAG: STAS domain-containing protein, partial [Clostridia bacterium]|nr:STAS domain-containing protein [Clostridia bacterium]